jgi:hypothetical protein
MTHKPLLGMYRRYKAETDEFAAWLASTAKHIGFPPNQLSSGSWDPTLASKTSKSTRLKGRERKEARAAAAQATQSTSSARYIVAVKDFEPLARFIVGHKKPRVQVPHQVCSTLERVIECRSSFAKVLADNDVTPDPESVDKHDYFLGILRSVQDILRPRMQKPPSLPAPSKEDTDERETATPRNMFQSLSLYEPSDEFLEGWHNMPGPSTTRERPQVSYRAEPIDDEREPAIAWTLLMADLAELRGHIINTWLSHMEGRIDLGAAAVGTNATLALAREMIEQTEATFERAPGGFRRMIRATFMALCEGHAGEGFHHIFEGEGRPFDHFYEQGHASYTISMDSLEAFDKSMPKDSPGLALGMAHSLSQLYDPARDRSAMTGTDRSGEDVVLAVEVMMDLQLLARGPRPSAFEDELTGAVRTFMATRKRRFATVFMIQTLFDIHNAMGAAVEASGDYVRRSVAQMKKDLASYLDIHNADDRSPQRRLREATAQGVVTMIELMEDDPIYKLKQNAGAEAGYTVDGGFKHRTMRLWPVMAGLWLHHVRNRMHKASIDIANSWFAIQPSAHLYNAAMSQGLLKRVWHDMEALIGIVGEDQIWVGGARPDDPSDFIKNFALLIGVPVADVAIQPARRHSLNPRARRPRTLATDSVPISRMFYNDGRPGKDEGWTLERIHSITALSTFSKIGRTRDGTADVYGADSSRVRREKRRALERNAKDKASGKRREPLPAVADIIEAMVTSLHLETVELTFPFLAMHNECYKLMRDATGPRQGSRQGPPPGASHVLGWEVPLILQGCATRDKKGIERVAAAINAMTANGQGDKVLAAAKATAGGAAASVAWQPTWHQRASHPSDE